MIPPIAAVPIATPHETTTLRFLLASRPTTTAIAALIAPKTKPTETESLRLSGDKGHPTEQEAADRVARIAQPNDTIVVRATW